MTQLSIVEVDVTGKATRGSHVTDEEYAPAPSVEET
jgi:hypothetical protein